MSKAMILGNGPSLLAENKWGEVMGGFASIYGVNRSYEQHDHHHWVTADEIALEEAITRFERTQWPQTLITTIPALARVAETVGVVRYRCEVQVFPMAGFSGTLAMRAAALQGHHEIYLVGFDGEKGERFYHEEEAFDRKEFGSAYSSLRDMIVEGFPEVKWHLFDGEKFIEYSRESEVEGWVR